MGVREQKKHGSQPTADQTASNALGREPTLADWLGDIDLRIGLIFLKPSRSELTDLFRERFKHRLESAVRNWTKICQSLQVSSDEEKQELVRITEAFQRCRYLDKISGSVLEAAIDSGVEVEIDQLHQDQQMLADEWSTLKLRPDINYAPDLLDCFSLVEQAMGCTSAEKGSLLREARNYLSNFSLGAENVPAIVRFLHGWTVYQIGQETEEAGQILTPIRDCANHRISSYFAFRLLSQFASADGSNARAGSWTRSALDIDEDPNCLVEAVLQMSSMSDPTRAIELLSKALMEEPGCIVRVLADPRCLNLGGEIPAAAVQALGRIRLEGRTAATRWVGIANDVEAARSQVGNAINVPYELENGHKQNLQRMDVADLISAGHLFRVAVASGDELTQQAQNSLGNELTKRSNAVSIARKATESVAGAREQKLKNAQQAYEGLRAQSANTVGSLDKETSRAEKMSLNSIIGGSVLFGLYVISQAVLDSQTIPLGFTKPLGMFIVVVSLLPIGLGGWMYLNAQAKKTAVTKKLNTSLGQAKKNLDDVSKNADDFYREQIEMNRKALAEAEEQLAKIQKALKLLKVDERNLELESKKGSSAKAA